MRYFSILNATIFGLWFSSVSCAGEPRRVVRASVPEYPELMYLSGIQGKFVVDLTVSAAGEVSDSVVVESPGRYFDPQITAHVKRWRFEPLDSTSVVTVQLVFRLIPLETGVEERGVFFVTPTTIEIVTRVRPTITDNETREVDPS